MLLITSVVAASYIALSTQNTVASICPPMCVNILEEEAAEVENTTMTNQAADGNLTGTNSTN